MEAEQYVLALTSVMDSREGFRRLTEALLEIDRELAKRRSGREGSAARELCFIESSSQTCREQALPIWKAMESSCESILLEKSQGRIFCRVCISVSAGNPPSGTGRKN